MHSVVQSPLATRHALSTLLIMEVALRHAGNSLADERQRSRLSDSSSPNIIEWTLPPPVSPVHQRPRIVNWYGVLMTGSLVSFGTWKAVASYNSWDDYSNALDWFLGVVWSLIFYWINQFKHVQSFRWLYDRSPTADLSQLLAPKVLHILLTSTRETLSVGQELSIFYWMQHAPAMSGASFTNTITKAVVRRQRSQTWAAGPPVPDRSATSSAIALEVGGDASALVQLHHKTTGLRLV